MLLILWVAIANIKYRTAHDCRSPGDALRGAIGTNQRETGDSRCPMPKREQSSVVSLRAFLVQGFSKMLSNKIRLLNLLDDKFSSVFEGASVVS